MWKGLRNGGMKEGIKVAGVLTKLKGGSERRVREGKRAWEVKESTLVQALSSLTLTIMFLCTQDFGWCGT